MTVLAICLLGFGLGRPPVELVALGMSAVAPLPTAAALLFLSSRGVGAAAHDRRPQTVMLLVRLASELRGGATLRTGIVSVFSSVAGHESVVRLAGAGRPMSVVGEELGRSLGRYGRLTGAAVRMISVLGGQAAPVIEQLAAQVIAMDDIRRERRVAAAPGILQAVLVGGVPLAALFGMLLSGRWVSLIAQGGLATVTTVAGTISVFGGVVWVAVLIGGSQR